MNTNIKPTLPNFCFMLRNAITAMGCSTVKGLNVLNSKLGDLYKQTKQSEPKTGDFKLKEFKKKSNKVTVSVKLGSASFELPDCTESRIAALNSALQSTVLSVGTFALDKESEIGKWFIQYAMPEVKPENTVAANI